MAQQIQKSTLRVIGKSHKTKTSQPYMCPLVMASLPQKIYEIPYQKLQPFETAKYPKSLYSLSIPNNWCGVSYSDEKPWSTDENLHLQRGSMAIEMMTGLSLLAELRPYLFLQLFALPVWEQVWTYTVSPSNDNRDHSRWIPSPSSMKNF